MTSQPLSAAPIRLIVFTAPWCHVCADLKRRRVVNQFAAVRHSDFEIQIHEGPDDPGVEDPIADAYNVKSLPKFVFEDTKTGAELLTREGSMNVAMLNKAGEEAQAVLAGTQKPKRNAPTREGGYPSVAAREGGGEEEEEEGAEP